MQTSFNNSDQPIATYSKHYGINDFKKLKIDENSALSMFYFNVAFLRKPYEHSRTFSFY